LATDLFAIGEVIIEELEDAEELNSVDERLSQLLEYVHH